MKTTFEIIICNMPRDKKFLAHLFRKLASNGRLSKEYLCNSIFKVFREMEVRNELTIAEIEKEAPAA
jgi:hypothetical protein